ncbi:MAG: hypothetical protein ABL962_06215 [Fimbriimonadaceae bacterium]
MVSTDDDQVVDWAAVEVAEEAVDLIKQMLSDAAVARPSIHSREGRCGRIHSEM